MHGDDVLGESTVLGAREVARVGAKGVLVSDKGLDLPGTEVGAEASAPFGAEASVGAVSRLCTTSSIKPKARASSGDMKLSRSFALAMTSTAWPQWCA